MAEVVKGKSVPGRENSRCKAMGQNWPLCVRIKPKGLQQSECGEVARVKGQRLCRVL